MPVLMRATTWCFWWPALAALLALLADHQHRPGWLTIFFTLVLMWPASLVAMHLAGARLGAAVGVMVTALIATRLFLPPLTYVLQPIALERPFQSTSQAARYTMQLPVTTRSWRALWSATPQPEAYLYVQVSESSGPAAAELTMALPDRITALSQENVFGGASFEQTSLGERAEYWHRVGVSRDELEHHPRFQVTIAPANSAQTERESAALMGGYSYRPTGGAMASEFLDGGRWTADPAVVVPGFPAGAGRARYFVELRIVEPATRRLLAIYY